MKKIKKGDHLSILGRRWFQKTYGNTYNTVEIRINGKLIHRIEMQYGYNSYYRQSAFEWLDKAGIIPRDKNDNGSYAKADWQMPEIMGFTFEDNVIDVQRKKDL